VKDSPVQLALRELTWLLSSRNLWLTFAAVVLLFAFTGPFGTLEKLPFLPRLAYWLVLHAGAWGTALVFAVLGDVLLARHVSILFWRMMIGAILAAIPIGVLIQLVGLAWFGDIPTGASLVNEMVMSVPLCIIFCVISYLAMSPAAAVAAAHPQQDASAMPPAVPAAAGPDATSPAPPPILSRLKPENRGALLHLSVEDHYTLVRTSRGRELILLRFSDALKETGARDGLQVHRSHWVASDFVAAVNRSDGKLRLALADGTEIPVSRTYLSEVRSRFAAR